MLIMEMEKKPRHMKSRWCTWVGMMNINLRWPLLINGDEVYRNFEGLILPIWRWRRWWWDSGDVQNNQWYFVGLIQMWARYFDGDLCFKTTNVLVWHRCSANRDELWIWTILHTRIVIYRYNDDDYSSSMNDHPIMIVMMINVDLRHDGNDKFQWWW